MGRNKVHDAATADAILLAAERLAETEGVDAVTIRRLAEEVGTTTRAVYSTFGGKDALLAALGVRAFEVLGTLVRRVPVTEDPAEDLVRLGAVAFRGFARRHTGLFRIGFDPRATPPQIWSEVEPVNAQAWQVVLDHVDRLGLGQPNQRLAVQFHSLCEGLAVNELRGNLGPPRTANRVWHEALAALIAGWPTPGAA